MKSRYRFLFPIFILWVAAAFWTAVSSARSAAPQKSTDTRKTSTPYTGDLSIFETPGREDKLQINRVMDILGITPGKNVADIGAGSGWFTVRAARRTGDAGQVYAVDINPEAIRYIDDRMRKEQLHNIKTIQGREDNPLLPENQIDAVLLLKTYHEVAKPVTLLRNLRPALRPGAQVGVIDRNGSADSHGVNREIVVKEFAEAGYQVASSYDFVKDGMDYFLVFTAKQ